MDSLFFGPLVTQGATQCLPSSAAFSANHSHFHLRFERTSVRSDGSVRTATVHSSIPLPVSGDHKAIVAVIQYLEETLAGGADPQYNFQKYGDIPLIP